MPSGISDDRLDALEQLKILIVDDHLSNVLILERMLRDAGYARIHTATDPRQVVDLCHRIKPDLLMLGLQMTPLDSVELRSRLQQLATTDQLPILVLTGDVSVDSRQQALSIGARDLVAKPLDQVEVLLRVRNLLETRQLHLQLERQTRLLAEHVEARTALTEQLRHTNFALGVANQAKARFLTSMGHELRTPLNAILGFTGTVLMGLAGPLNDEQAYQLRTVQSSGRHLLSLINNLLDLATIESGRDELKIEPIDGPVLLDEVALELRPLADEKGLRLVVEADAEIEICTDRRAVRQILSNLTSNAITFTDNGVVALELSQRRDEAGSVALFTVRDTGCGVTREDQDRLFDPFARIGGLDARRTDTGLGLYTSQTLAALLGGVISVQSETGSGSAFTLELSAAAEPVAKRSGR